MTSGVLRCADGQVTISPDGAPLCSGVWTLVPVPEPFELAQIDPAIAGQMFLLGFSLLIPLWFAAMCAGAILSMINKR